MRGAHGSSPASAVSARPGRRGQPPRQSPAPPPSTTGSPPRDEWSGGGGEAEDLDQRGRRTFEIERVDEQGGVSLLATAAGAHEPAQLLLDGPRALGRLSPHPSPRRAVTGVLDHLLHTVHADGTDQL